MLVLYYFETLFPNLQHFTLTFSLQFPLRHSSFQHPFAFYSRAASSKVACTHADRISLNVAADKRSEVETGKLLSQCEPLETAVHIFISMRRCSHDAVRDPTSQLPMVSTIHTTRSCRIRRHGCPQFPNEAVAKRCRHQSNSNEFSKMRPALARLNGETCAANS